MNYEADSKIIMTDLYVKVLGEGTPVVLVHGSGGNSEQWEKQLPLATRFKLIMPDRRGYGHSPPTSFIDYKTDAVDIADLIGTGAHIVGESYGAVGSLFAAALKPKAVLSLTVIEPPLFWLVRGDPVADEIVTRTNLVFETMRNATPEEFVFAFNKAVGFEALPMTMDQESRSGVESMMKERAPTDARVPLDLLKAAPFPKLVVSGGWSEVFEATCNELAKRIGAKRVVMKGAGHEAFRAGDSFNKLLSDFWG